MNITLGTGKAVHTALSENHKNTTSCGGSRAAQGYQQTDADVTCKKCLKILADREEAAKRTAYYAGLADQQDETLSQAPTDEMDAAHAEALAIDATVTEALDETPTDQCCEHAPMYHGARGCDECACTTPRKAVTPTVSPLRLGNARPAFEQPKPETEAALTVNRTIYTDQGQIPPYALMMDVTQLAWIPGVHRGSVVTAMDDGGYDGELRIWVYVERDGSLPKVLYFGANWTLARDARDGYVERDKRDVEWKSFNGHAWRAPGPSEVTMTVYRTEPKTTAPKLAHETDPRTGLPIVTVRGNRYVVGLWQRTSFGDVDYVDYWLASESVGSHMVRRAYADATTGTVARQVWDAQRALR